MTRNTSVTVTEAALEEVVSVNRTVAEFDAPMDVGYFTTRIGERQRLVLVAHVGHDAAGYLVSYDRDQDGSLYCGWAGVNPDFRRQGVLSALMNYQTAWAKSSGYAKITVRTHNKHRSMLAYLVNAGFLFTAVVPKADTAENIIAVEKSL